MVSCHPDDQAVADEIATELENKNYDVVTSEGGGGHTIAQEYVDSPSSLKNMHVAFRLVCLKT